MALDLISIIVGLIVLFIFYILTTALIREGLQLIFKIKNNGYFQASEISIPITLFLLLQLVLGSNAIMNSILGFISAILVLFLVKRTYNEDWRVTLQIWLYILCCVLAIFLVTALLVYVTG